MENYLPLLIKLKKFLKQEVHQNINSLDYDTALLKTVFKKYRERNFFKIFVPKSHGGITLAHEDKITFQEIMGQSGGALAFLQAQIATAAWIIINGNNSALRDYHLPLIASGKLLLGNATAQMKPTQKPIISGVATDGGYKVSGIIPFASGWAFMKI